MYVEAAKSRKIWIEQRGREVEQLMSLNGTPLLVDISAAPRRAATTSTVSSGNGNNPGGEDPTPTDQQASSTSNNGRNDDHDLQANGQEGMRIARVGASFSGDAPAVKDEQHTLVVVTRSEERLPIGKRNCNKKSSSSRSSGNSNSTISPHSKCRARGVCVGVGIEKIACSSSNSKKPLLLSGRGSASSAVTAEQRASKATALLPSMSHKEALATTTGTGAAASEDPREPAMDKNVEFTGTLETEAGALDVERVAATASVPALPCFSRVDSSLAPTGGRYNTLSIASNLNEFGSCWRGVTGEIMDSRSAGGATILTRAAQSRHSSGSNNMGHSKRAYAAAGDTFLGQDEAARGGGDGFGCPAISSSNSPKSANYLVGDGGTMRGIMAASGAMNSGVTTTRTGTPWGAISRKKSSPESGGDERAGVRGLNPGAGATSTAVPTTALAAAAVASDKVDVSVDKDQARALLASHLTPFPTITKNRSLHALPQPIVGHSDGFADACREGGRGSRVDVWRAAKVAKYDELVSPEEREWILQQINAGINALQGRRLSVLA